MPSQAPPSLAEPAPSAPDPRPAAAGPAPDAGPGDPARDPDRDVVGVIYGDVGTSSFRFAVKDPALRRTAYVVVPHDEAGEVLAQVTDVERETDLDFDAARGLDDDEEADVRDRLTAHAKVIGYRDRRDLLQHPSTPFRAGARVRRAPEELIAGVFGLPAPPEAPALEDGDASPALAGDGTLPPVDPDHRPDGAYLGKVKDHGIPVTLDLNELVQKHVSVLAKTGAGKSYAVGVLMEELAKHGVPIVVLDPHGEHASLAHPNDDEGEYDAMRRFGVRPRNYSDHLVSWSPDTLANPGSRPLALDGRDLTSRELEDLVGQNLTNTQSGILHESLKHLRETTRTYGLEDVVEEVKTSDSSARWNLLSALEGLRDLDLLEGAGTDPTELVQRDRVSVVNLRGAEPHVAEIVVARLAKSLFEARKRGEVPPFMLVVEEAHNFCPERTYDHALSGDVLRTIASEGRKFGMGLSVISQRPAKVDKNVLSQCNTEIVLKVTNPNDLKALVASVEGLTKGMEDEIQRLPVGVAVVSHPAIREPVLCEVRPRETRHGGASVDVLADDGPPEGLHEVPDALPFPEDVPDDDATDPEDAGELEDPAPDGDADPDPADGIDADRPVDTDPDPGPEGPSPPDEADADLDPAVDATHGPDEDPPEDPDAPDPALQDGPGEVPGEVPDVDPPVAAIPGHDPDETGGDPDLEAPAPEEETAPDATPVDDPEDAPPEGADRPDPDTATEPPADGTGGDDADAPASLDLREAAAADDDATPAPDDAVEIEGASPADLRVLREVQTAADLLDERDPRALPTERVRRLVQEVQALLHRLGGTDLRGPEAVKARNALALQLVRYRRRLATPAPDAPGGADDGRGAGGDAPRRPEAPA